MASLIYGLIINHMKERGGLGALKQRHSSLFASTSILHLPAPRDSIKVDTFLLCFRHCGGCQDLQELIGKERGTFGCVWVGCSKKTNRSSFYFRGHPQTPVGDVLTELPTKLKVERRKKKQRKKM